MKVKSPEATRCRGHPAVSVIARMFAQYQETNAALLRVVATVAPDRCVREDLLQEALIHLWHLKNLRPEQSPSWYFKSCQLHLLNLLRKGRSLDSLKRRECRIPLREPTTDDSNESTGLDQLSDNADPEGPVFAEVCGRDILISMHRRLDPADRLILDFMANGLSMREVASRLQLSHTAVIKRQRKIASIAWTLGLAPSSRSQARPQKKGFQFRRRITFKASREEKPAVLRSGGIRQVNGRPGVSAVCQAPDRTT